MERRAFLRTGFAGAVGAAALSPPIASAATRRAWSAWFDPRHADDTIRLSSNENPLGVCEAGRRAVLEGMPEANRYPGAAGGLLRTAVAERLGVPEDALFFGAGSTEVLRVAVQAWSGPGARLVYAEPTFEDVPGYARPFPYRPEPVPLDEDLAHDLGRMREIVERDASPAVVYVCNPNNPTGTLTSSADLESWIADASDRVLFLVDEAYLEFVEDPAYRSAIEWTERRTNVVVVRTFSKIYGMAGMRVGFGVAHPSTVARLRPFVTRNNPNQPGAVAALASLEDPEMVPRSLDVNRTSRDLLHECLDELGLEYLPSHTNFVMHRIRGDLETHIERMREEGIRVGRPFPPMLEWNRVSLGLPEEMERFAETLREFRRRGWA